MLNVAKGNVTFDTPIGPKPSDARFKQRQTDIFEVFNHDLLSLLSVHLRESEFEIALGHMHAAFGKAHSKVPERSP